MFESDDYRHGADQARNGITRDPSFGRMSRAEIQGYCDEIDRQKREKAQRGVHLELAKNPTILFNILNNKAIDSRIPCE